MAMGKSMTLLLSGSELSTQQVADILNVSRPHVIKLLENGTIPYRKLGKHRRVMFDDLMDYEAKQKKREKKKIRCIS
jgi:excisionase family DNA binding protein